MANTKDIKQLVKLLRDQGFLVERRSSTHYVVLKADGTYVTDLAASPSDYRGLQNAKATLRHFGFLDPQKPQKKKGERS